MKRDSKSRMNRDSSSSGARETPPGVATPARAHARENGQRQGAAVADPQEDPERADLSRVSTWTMGADHHDNTAADGRPVPTCPLCKALRRAQRASPRDHDLALVSALGDAFAKLTPTERHLIHAELERRFPSDVRTHRR